MSRSRKIVPAPQWARCIGDNAREKLDEAESGHVLSPFATLSEIDPYELDDFGLGAIPMDDNDSSAIDDMLGEELDEIESFEIHAEPEPVGVVDELKTAVHNYQITRALDLMDQAVKEFDGQIEGIQRQITELSAECEGLQQEGHDVETLQLQIEQLTAERAGLGTTPIPMETIGRLVTLAADSGRMDDAISVIRYGRQHSDIAKPLTKAYNAVIRRMSDGKTADDLYEMLVWELTRLTQADEHTKYAHGNIVKSYTNLLRKINQLGQESPEQMEGCQVFHQLTNEISAVDKSVEDYEKDRMEMERLGKTALAGPGKQLVRNWYAAMVEAIQEEQDAIENSQRGVPDRYTYGPFLLTLKASELAVIALNGMMSMATKNVTASTNEGGVKFTPLASFLGSEVQAETQYSKLKSNLTEKKRDGDLSELQFMWGERDLDKKKSRPAALQKLAKQALDDPAWGQRIEIKVGAALIDLVMANATFQNKEGEDIPAFTRHYQNMDGGQSVKQFAIIQFNPKVRVKIESDHEVMSKLHPQLPPMVCHPQPWTDATKGGYLQLSTSLMRTKGVKSQMQALRSADLRQIFRALDTLSAVRWRVDPTQFGLLKEVWARGGGIAGIPSAEDPELYTETPPKLEKTSELEPEEKTAYNRRRARIKRDNANMNSLRCDFKLKLEVAESALGHPIWFPHNVDFRGRAYPVPPHFNHLAADPSRGLLLFDEAKPLGADGLHWVKIHLANLFGEDKRTFDGRIDFVEDNMAAIIDSADRPLDGDQWWLNADEPWQCLLSCRELATAMRNPEGPEAFLSRLPVHQDGSCNGLQHYAALGRDPVGAAQVDLIPAEMPQDVYSGVMELVKEQVIKEAQGKTPVGSREPEKLAADRLLAEKLVPFINRKTVKQTVMTSVYGVTFVGARQQIQNRLQESKFDEDLLYDASIYLAKLTLSSIGKKFVGADKVKEWLADCAQAIAGTGQDVAWINPLGLPVVQPYRKERKSSIKTRMQTLVMTSVDDQPVMKTRQKSAFPPNFVHSLDSTHMMLTALRCGAEHDMAFAAVHDSYWTHGCDIPVMNQILREEFVNLHSQPLLENLRSDFWLRHPDVDLPKLPDMGDLDLQVVKNSPYFFD